MSVTQIIQTKQKPTIDELIEFLTKIKEHCATVGKVGIVDAVDSVSCENMFISGAITIEHSHHVEIVLQSNFQKK